MGQDFGEARHKGTHHQEVYEFFVKILIINLIFICDSLKLSCGYLNRRNVVIFIHCSFLFRSI